MKKYEIAIFDIINNSCDHMTVRQIYEKLKERYPDVVLATVYNNVNKMWEAGYIRKITVEGMPDRYDKIQRHDHKICRICGKISDVCFDDLIGQLRSRLGEEVTSYDLKIFYVCDTCKENTKQ